MDLVKIMVDVDAREEKKWVWARMWCGECCKCGVLGCDICCWCRMMGCSDFIYVEKPKTDQTQLLSFDEKSEASGMFMLRENRDHERSGQGGVKGEAMDSLQRDEGAMQNQKQGPGRGNAKTTLRPEHG